MSEYVMLIVSGAKALSSFKSQRLLADLQTIEPSIDWP
jgi:hypothetical protein